MMLISQKILTLFRVSFSFEEMTSMALEVLSQRTKDKFMSF